MPLGLVTCEHEAFWLKLDELLAKVRNWDSEFRYKTPSSQLVFAVSVPDFPPESQGGSEQNNEKYIWKMW